MSGGYFGHQQYSMSIIADEIEEIIEDNLLYSDKTKHILKEMVLDLQDLKDKVTRVDYLLSGDISEDDFLADYL